ncbi:hypothetical protein C8J57DRAFT_1466275 [Mycena rebaudengoi]|nr:hypothetical protein C8J57DRAFT_1466275 [Mycena rebaudengoi]
MSEVLSIILDLCRGLEDRLFFACRKPKNSRQVGPGRFEPVVSQIRRLPVKIIIDILFTLCAGAPEHDNSFQSWASQTSQERLDTLAQTHLVQLSQDSHGDLIVVEMDLKHWSRLYTRILVLSLERSATFPLSISLWAGATRAAFRRQKQVNFLMDLPVFEFISSAKGNLPLLQTVHLPGTNVEEVNIFEVAPRLSRIYVEGLWRPGLPLFPWIQLNQILYLYSQAQHSLPLMPHCVSDSVFWLWHVTVSAMLPHSLQPIISDIRSLGLTLDDQGDSLHCSRMFDEIIANFTLPRLRVLCIGEIGETPTTSTQDTLETLQLGDVSTTDHEPIECLVRLPLLEHLLIVDLLLTDGEGEDVHDRHIVVTDHLLARLFWTSDSTTCVLCFDARLLLDQVKSRISPRSQGPPFQFHVCRAPSCQKDLDPDVWAQLRDLDNKRELMFFYF